MRFRATGPQFRDYDSSGSKKKRDRAESARTLRASTFVELRFILPVLKLKVIREGNSHLLRFPLSEDAKGVRVCVPRLCLTRDSRISQTQSFIRPVAFGVEM